MKVFIIAAMSADGFIARSTTELANWTSKEDKKVFVRLTKRAGVMVMGATTFATIGKALPGRRNIVYTRQQLDKDDIEATAEPPTELIERLAKEGLQEVAICGGRTIYDMFMQANLVDEIYLTLEPEIFGSGITLFASVTHKKLKLLESQKLNEDTLLLHYEVKK